MLTSSQWPGVLTLASKQCTYVFVLMINHTWLSMFCLWFVTLWKSSFPRTPLTRRKLLPLNPPYPLEFPMIFHGGAGGDGYFLEPHNTTARQLHLETRLVDGLLPMQPRFQANILLINLISNNYTKIYTTCFLQIWSMPVGNEELPRGLTQSEAEKYFEWIIIIITIYTLSDLGDSSNLIGSLSQTMTLHSPRYAVNVKQNKIAVMNWVFCQSFIVRTFWKYKNIQVLMTLKVRKDFMVFKQRDFLWSVWCMRLLSHCFVVFGIFSQHQFCL